VIREVGASGGYWIACAADEIHANPMSVVGSIGVVGGGFGFPDLLTRLGIERRIYTAGTNKARLDPFSPEKPEDVAFARDLMDKLHTRFKDWVRARRGARLSAPDDTIFDGGYMLGEQALAVGLIDSLTTIEDLVQQLGGDRAHPRRIAPKRPRLALRLPRLALDTALDAIEERAGRINLR
jgi:ClpP class serine protease